MVEFVEAPEHPDPVIREVRQPVAPVHRHEDHGDDEPARNDADSRHDNPGQRPARHLGERERERGTERDDERRVQHRIEKVLAVTPGEERPALRGTQPLDDEQDAKDAKRERTDDDDAQARHRGSETGATPSARPTNRDEDGGDRDNRERGHVDA